MSSENKIVEFCEAGHVYWAAHNHEKCGICGAKLTQREIWHPSSRENSWIVADREEFALR